MYDPSRPSDPTVVCLDANVVILCVCVVADVVVIVVVNDGLSLSRLSNWL